MKNIQIDTIAINDVKACIPNTVTLVNDTIKALQQRNLFQASEITMDLIIRLKESDQPIQDMFKPMFIQLCDEYGISIENHGYDNGSLYGGSEARNINPQLYDQLHLRCVTKVQPMWTAKRVLKHVWGDYLKYIQIIDGVAKPVNDIDKVLIRDFTIKADSSDQDKVSDILNGMISDIDKLAKYGITRFHLPYMFIEDDKGNLVLSAEEIKMIVK